MLTRPETSNIYTYILHSSFSNLSAALPTSQLILQPFRCFTYVIRTSPTSYARHLRHMRFTYVIGTSYTSYALHLSHSLFSSNPSAASPTSQVILQPFRSFTYVTGTSRTSPDEPLAHKGMKKQSVVDYLVTASLEVATVLDS